ncbi:MAG: hypothetical protein ACO1QR_02570 [Chthoniobacteraceae bacterium]
MQPTSNDYSHIKGWGIDADPENDPTYPMKRRNNAEHAGYSWQRPTQQAADVEVLHSNERPNLSAVFGRSSPPSGVSGMLRRLAFKYSESSYLHWLPLMFADRVNEVEGVVSDIARGRVPNIPKELGWAAEWKHNRKGLLTRILLGVVVTSAVIAYFSRDGDDDHHSFWS